MFASNVFPHKNQKPLRMSRMQITKQAVAILSPISGTDLWCYSVTLSLLYVHTRQAETYT